MTEEQSTQSQSVRLPCYRGDMLLLKYLELRLDDPPTLDTLAEEFDDFVKPVDGLIPPRPARRVFEYLRYLEDCQFAQQAETEHGATVHITPVGMLVSGGVDLEPELETQWRTQGERLQVESA